MLALVTNGDKQVVFWLITSDKHDVSWSHNPTIPMSLERRRRTGSTQSPNFDGVSGKRGDGFVVDVAREIERPDDRWKALLEQSRLCGSHSLPPRHSFEV